MSHAVSAPVAHVPLFPILRRSCPTTRAFSSVCVWPYAVSGAYNAIVMELKKVLAGHPIMGIQRVYEKKTGSIRHGLRVDLFLPANAVLSVVRCLRAYRYSDNGKPWRVKEWIPFLSRERAVSTPLLYVNSRKAASHTCVLSLNTNGVKQKAVEISFNAINEGCSVLLLQETLRTEEAWPLRIPGFVVFDQVRSGEGVLGVAVAVRSSLVSMGLTQSNKFVQWVQILLEGVPWIFGSVYLPGKGKSNRKEGLSVVEASCREVCRRFPRTRLVLGGDFQCDSGSLSNLLAKWKLGFLVIPKRGSRDTYFAYSGRASSELDHFVMNEIAQQSLGVCRVRNSPQWMISDHRPIVVGVKLSGQGVGSSFFFLSSLLPWVFRVSLSEWNGLIAFSIALA